MSATSRPRKAAAYTYTVVSLTQHWRLIDGRYYRDAVARRSDGQLRLISLPDAGEVAA